VKCPHARIQHCPLYVESHNCRQLGCVDDPAKLCLVERGKMKYEKALRNLRAEDARLVAICEFNEKAHESREQISRNMRLMGIH
jgi:hypothetical protein